MRMRVRKGRVREVVIFRMRMRSRIFLWLGRGRCMLIWYFWGMIVIWIERRYSMLIGCMIIYGYVFMSYDVWYLFLDWFFSVNFVCLCLYFYYFI